MSVWILDEAMFDPSSIQKSKKASTACFKLSHKFSMTSNSGECGVILPQHSFNLSHLNELLYNEQFCLWCECRKAFFSLPSHTYVQIQHQDALQGFGGDSFWQSAAYAAPVIFLAWPEFNHSCACALLFPDYCPYSWNWVQTSERCFCSLPLNHSTDNLCFQIFWELLWESSSVSVQCQREAQLESFHLKYIFLWLDMLAYEVQGLTS